MVLGEQFWLALEECQELNLKACTAMDSDQDGRSTWHRRYHDWYDFPVLESDAMYCRPLGNWYLTLSLHVTCGPWARVQGFGSPLGP